MSKLNWGMRACGIFLLSATAAVALSAPTFTSLYNFCSQANCRDGSQPYAGLIQAANGTFYGTTVGGGANNDGTVFKITTNGTLTTLHSFDFRDSAHPEDALVQAKDGNIYGTTESGGTNRHGTIFTITPSGALTTLYNFCSQSGCADGTNPDAALVEATNGDFYGTTGRGGANNNCGGGCGTVFTITPSGTLTTLYSFCLQSGCADGKYPLAGLVQAADGKLYGTTYYGGANSRGTLFEITPNGALTILYTFCSQSGCADGKYPLAGLVQATNGMFYGTTSDGGANAYYGTVFKINPSGKLTTLHSFNGTDGYSPESALVQATDGNFYGTTKSGGTYNAGTVFKITPGGTLTTLHSFDGTDGYYPYAGLAQATDGKFYGTAAYGGTGIGNACTSGCGTVFSLSVGLGPFVATQPTSGEVGAHVKILGTNLTGATSVTFNGTAATFTVKSKSEITTTVPSGATTGTVQVVTPGGTLSSNVPFRVK
jgi:uncharacterized repeat protein (TIGR03803 family)